MKIFCKNCKYYESYTFYYQPRSHNCKHISNIEYIETPLEMLTKYIRKIEVLNKDNNCKYYKKNWYLF